MRYWNKLTKFGAYLILLAGSFLSAVLFGFAIYFGFIYPGANLSGRIVVSTVIIVAAVAAFIISISVFETIIETIRIEGKLENGNNKNRLI